MKLTNKELFQLSMLAHQYVADMITFEGSPEDAEELALISYQKPTPLKHAKLLLKLDNKYKWSGC